MPSGRFSRLPGFGNPVSADRLRPVGSRSQGVAEVLEFRFQAVLEHRHALKVDPGGTFVGGDSKVRRVQVALGMDLIDQSEPTSSLDPLFEGRQHPLRPDRGFDPPPAEEDRSGACSPFRTRPPVCFPPCRTSRLHLPAPLRSTGMTRLPRYHGCSDSQATGSWYPYQGQ